jgi:hypothetical protein
MVRRHKHSSADLAKWGKRAREKVRLYLSRYRLKQKDLTLSASTIGRVWKPEAGFTTWFANVDRLYTELNHLATRRSAPPPAKWSEFFGEDFPRHQEEDRETVRTYNHVQVPREQVRDLASSLIEYLLAQARLAKLAENVWKASELFDIVARILALSGEWEEAIDVLGELTKLNAATGDFHYEADALLRLSQALLQLSDNSEVERAQKHIDEGLALIESHQDSGPPYRTLLRLHNYQSEALIALGRYSEARDILTHRCLPLATRRCSQAATASVWHRLGVVCTRLGGDDLNAAFAYLVASLSMRIRLNLKSQAAQSLLQMGLVHFGRAELLQALFILNLSARYQQALGDREHIAKTLLHIGETYLRLADSMSDVPADSTIYIKPSEEYFSDETERRILLTLSGQLTLESLTVPSQRQRILHLARSKLMKCQHLAGRTENSLDANAAKAERLLEYIGSLDE